MSVFAPAMWAGPSLVLIVLVTAWWFELKLSESAVAQMVIAAFGWTSVCCVGLLTQFVGHSPGAPLELAEWFSVGHYATVWNEALDPLALLLSLLASGLILLIAVFSRSYLHSETGYLRFYLLTTLFGLGVLLVALSGSLAQLLFGWELVGVTSALLIAFFSHRVTPARSALRAFLSYRVGDIGLLSAVALLHHVAGTTDFHETGQHAWLGVHNPGTPGVTTALLLLVLMACAGKSALAPFCGWLPRAMEGPTPSSAVFYGALSINLGPFLLLRCWPLLESSPVGRVAVFVVGLATVVHGTLVGRVQSDAKSALAYGSMTQVGLVVMEIALGWYALAVVHMIGHACLRTLELLRAPSLLHDYSHLEKSLGEVLPRMGAHYERMLTPGARSWLYRQALERGAFEALALWAVQVWVSVASRLHRADVGLEALLCGAPDEMEKR